jgi:HEAT repeat protein
MHSLWPSLLFAAVFSLPALGSSKKAYRASGQGNSDSLLRILSAENQRTLQDPYLASAIHHPTPSVRQAAIYAVARIGDSSLLGELSAILNRRRDTAKEAAIFALGVIPNETALTMAIQHLAMQQDPEVLSALYVSIGRAGNEKRSPFLPKPSDPKRTPP